jgi:hypothetical protein
MLSLKRNLLLALAAATLAVGQPALTTIQDTLYRADGSRFNGTVFITWNSFLAGDTSNIATSNLTLNIVNGVLKVGLVPTTTASPGAQYNVKYNSNGINQFTEVWAVPPSDLPLRVRDVRVSVGSIVGPPPVTSPVQISDVTGLTNELLIRPMRGVGFALGRAAVINSSGQIDGATGSLSDCLRVDGSSTPCSGSGGGGSASQTFIDGETPVGTVNGINTTFTLAFAPSPPGSLLLYRNGLEMLQGTDYVLSSRTITFLLASVPVTGDTLLAYYRFGANTTDPQLTYPQIYCSAAGAATSSVASIHLGTCTIPGGTLSPGDRLEVQFQYGHTGTSTGFTGEVKIGSSSTVLRNGASGDATMVGKATFGVATTGQAWDGQSWGTTLTQVVGAGSANEDLTNSLLIDFRGNLSTTAADTLTLKNFTVIRYPAQSNP